MSSYGAACFDWPSIDRQGQSCSAEQNSTNRCKAGSGEHRVTVASTAAFNKPTPDLLDVEVQPGKIQLAGHAEPIKPIDSK
jgi:hypothetical protein